jgi:hypothetical protein
VAQLPASQTFTGSNNFTTSVGLVPCIMIYFAY